MFTTLEIWWERFAMHWPLPVRRLLEILAYLAILTTFPILLLIDTFVSPKPLCKHPFANLVIALILGFMYWGFGLVIVEILSMI